MASIRPDEYELGLQKPAKLHNFLGSRVWSPFQGYETLSGNYSWVTITFALGELSVILEISDKGLAFGD